MHVRKRKRQEYVIFSYQKHPFRGYVLAVSLFEAFLHPDLGWIEWSFVPTSFPVYYQLLWKLLPTRINNKQFPQFEISATKIWKYVTFGARSCHKWNAIIAKISFPFVLKKWRSLVIKNQESFYLIWRCTRYKYNFKLLCVFSSLIHFKIINQLLFEALLRLADDIILLTPECKSNFSADRDGGSVISVRVRVGARES